MYKRKKTVAERKQEMGYLNPTDAPKCKNCDRSSDLGYRCDWENFATKPDSWCKKYKNEPLIIVKKRWENIRRKND